MFSVQARALTPEALMAYQLKRRRKPPAPAKPAGPSKFTDKLLTQMARDVKSGAIPVPKVNPIISLGDDQVPGLRAIVRKSGAVSFHQMYNIGDSRPMVTIGHFPATTIEQARRLGRTIRGLAELGIDIQEGNLPRTMKELERDGMSWRPFGYVDKVIDALRTRGIRISDAIAAEVKKELA